MRLSCLLAKMNSTFAEWKAKRDGNRQKPAASTSPFMLTSRLKTTSPEPGAGSDGIYSFNQMERHHRERGGRPISEVGSVRSIRSVLTVEEQVNTMEKRVDDIKAEMEEMRKQNEQTNRLLLELLTVSKANSFVPTSTNSGPAQEGKGLADSSKQTSSMA